MSRHGAVSHSPAHTANVPPDDQRTRTGKSGHRRRLSPLLCQGHGTAILKAHDC
jgi:hypothetical protein